MNVFNMAGLHAASDKDKSKLLQRISRSSTLQDL